MKRILVLMLILTLLLCGCGKEKQPTDSNDNHATLTPDANTAQTPDLEPTEFGYEQQAMVAVSLPVINEATQADDGTTVCDYAYQNIYLVVQDQQIADAVIIDFLNRQDTHHAAVKSISDQALSEYTGQEDWTPYYYECLYSPTRVDYNVLSLYAPNTNYLGAGHSQVECKAVNYNMITGDVLTLGSILYHMDAKEKLCDLVIENLAPLADTVQLFEEYPDVVRHRFSREESYDEDWFFTESGLSFFFTPYEVAPYIAGVVTVEVPYEQLSGIIADEFFPLEEDASEGVIHEQLLKDMDLQAFTQIAEVPLSAEGEYIFLFCDGLVRNVKLEVGTWDESGTNFTPTCTVFATYALTPGDGITIQAKTPHTSRNLRLSYRSGDQIITTFIS